MPRVVHLTDRQATVAWETDEPAVGEVFYGSTVYLGEAARQPEEGRAHRVSLTNLKPDTRYIFRVRVTDRADNSSRLSATQVFTTPAERDTVPPTAPAELAAEPGGTEARLRWLVKSMRPRCRSAPASQAQQCTRGAAMHLRRRS